LDAERQLDIGSGLNLAHFDLGFTRASAYDLRWFDHGPKLPYLS
jgi:hypothetical protein